MNLSLDSDDREMLERLIEQALMDKRVEVRRTTTPRYHDEMVAEEGRLKELLERVRALSGAS